MKAHRESEASLWYKRQVVIDLLTVAEVRKFLSGLSPVERQVLSRDNQRVFQFIVFKRRFDLISGRCGTAQPGKIKTQMWLEKLKEWVFVAGSSRLGSVYQVVLEGGQKMPPHALCVKFVKGVLARTPHPVPSVHYTKMVAWKKKMHLSEIHSQFLSRRRT
jgi:hypothetical protein